MLAHLEDLAGANRARADRLVCFAGGGAYDHEVPPVVRALAGRSEFVTSYTPYQPEVAQGVLQAVFEFQTMVARLAGLPVANASLYDGASALVEAVNLGVAASGRPTVWVSAGVHPHWRARAAPPSPPAPGTGCRGRAARGRADRVAGRRGGWPSRPGSWWSGYPNYLGCLEDLGEARGVWRRATAPCWWWRPTRWRPAILRAPGRLGGRRGGGRGPGLRHRPRLRRPLPRPVRLHARAGAPAARAAWSARPSTREGRRAYVTTLRAREQDIRREKATSNVCTNQTLMAVTAAVQLGWLGTSGLAEVALRCARGTRYCRAGAARPRRGGAAHRRRRPSCGSSRCARRCRPAWWWSGWPTRGSWPGWPWPTWWATRATARSTPTTAAHGLLVAVTERRTRAEIDALRGGLDKAVRP